MTNLFNNVRVTIGVCVKDCRHTIGDAISSIGIQDFPHELTEVIFVDDGSRDDTLSIINENLSKFDMQTRVFHHDWKGLGITRNVVVNNSCGKYIIWVDGDMCFSKSFVGEQIEFMERNPEVGIGKAKYDLNSQGSLVSDLENMESAIANLRRRGKAESIPLGTGGAIYRVEAIRGVGGFDEKIAGVGEDMDAEQRISASGWMLDVTSAVFREKRRRTWGALWTEYFWHGKGNSFLFTSRKESFDPKKFLLPIIIKTELSRVIAAYKLTGRKVSLLLPLNYVFKRTAWLLGFVNTLFS
jgi:glycosyltransferase involved in cell wall biosynthesis